MSKKKFHTNNSLIENFKTSLLKNLNTYLDTRIWFAFQLEKASKQKKIDHHKIVSLLNRISIEAKYALEYLKSVIKDESFKMLDDESKHTVLFIKKDFEKLVQENERDRERYGF